jgi:hypothetical protein
MKYEYKELSANCVAFMSCRRLQLMKATVLAESPLYFIFSPESLRSSDVYRRESGRCHTLPFFLSIIKRAKMMKIKIEAKVFRQDMFLISCRFKVSTNS